MDVTSTSTACMIGSCIFLLGLFLAFIYENFECNDSLTFILSHWFIFFWLVNDIYFLSYNKSSKAICGKVFVPLIYYLIILFIICRLRLFYIFYKEKILPTFHSGRVYSLIRPPTAF
jgi:hypothetical protein